MLITALSPHLSVQFISTAVKPIPSYRAINPQQLEAFQNQGRLHHRNNSPRSPFQKVKRTPSLCDLVLPHKSRLFRCFPDRLPVKQRVCPGLFSGLWLACFSLLIARLAAVLLFRLFSRLWIWLFGAWSRFRAARVRGLPGRTLHLHPGLLMIPPFQF